MLVSRLDAQCERPEERDIPQDLLAEVADCRGELVRHAQTIIAAHIAAGRPKLGLKPIGSFGDWSRLVREPLVWAGAADPVATIARARGDDPSIQNRATVLTACYAACGDAPFTVASLIGMAEARAQNAAPELKEALLLVALSGGKLDGNRLGQWLRYNRDCRVAGLTLTRRGELGSSGGASWRVERQ
jgi:putative DNA primase/helicase